MQPQNSSIGAIAQLVEQRTENPCVPGSIPGGTTNVKKSSLGNLTFFVFNTLINTYQKFTLLFLSVSK